LAEVVFERKRVEMEEGRRGDGEKGKGRGVSFVVVLPSLLCPLLFHPTPKLPTSTEGQ